MKNNYSSFATTFGAAAAAALFSLSQDASASALFTSGHGDFAVGFHDGMNFEFGYHLAEGSDTAIVDGIVVNDEEYEADELIVQVTEQLTIPTGADPSLLGATGSSTGSIIYLVSQDATGVSSPILGLGTEELEEPTGVTWSDVTYTLLNSNGPGLFSLYFNDAGTLEVDISEALSVDSFSFPAGGHEERNWVFTAPGTYELEFRAEATLTEGGASTLYSATETFTFEVIPEPSSSLLLAGSALGLLLRRRRC